METDRRGFLELTFKLGMIAAGGALGLRYEQKPNVYKEKSESELEWDASLAILRRVDRIYDRLPVLDVPINEETFGTWILEVVPWFAEVGLTDTPAYPEKYSFARYKDPTSALHVLGTSVCGQDITANARLSDGSLSSFERPSKDSLAFWGGEVHELAHTQQGQVCLSAYDRTEVEKSAQVATLAVLAAMTTDGNRIAGPTFVYKLRDIALGSLYYMSLRDGREEFWQIWDSVNSTPLEKALIQRIKNSWEGYRKRQQLKKILYTYNYLPLKMLLEAHANHDFIDGLEFPHPHFFIRDFGYLMEDNHLEGIIDELSERT